MYRIKGNFSIGRRTTGWGGNPYFSNHSTRPLRVLTAAAGVACLLAGVCLLSLPAAAQGAGSAEVKEKPRLYTYVALWSLPRAQWADWAK